MDGELQNAQGFSNSPCTGSSRLLSVAWIVYRGPAKVAFEPEGFQSVTDAGTAVTMATFSEPGPYVLRAIAFDGMLQNAQDVAVAVEAREAPNR